MVFGDNCPGCGKSERECPQFGDECWRNNGCPSEPPAGPEMPEGYSYEVQCGHCGGGVALFPLEAIREGLATQGLRIVGEAEAKVLEAIDAIPEQELRSSGNWYGWAKPIGEAVRAQRARRAQQKEKP